jgi:aminoglycoside phosphotransferase family enzyme/predicted kinase
MGSSDAAHGSPTAPSLPDLLAALSQPSCYPHHPAHVEVVQTHISAVFLAGEVVYKLKKPVRFSFLNYSTLALRQHYCQEEVRLNRRLAPTVYLGVVPIAYTGDAYRVREAVNMKDAAVVDYLVWMRRLPLEQYALIQDFSQQFFTEHQEFTQRITQDRVREGHGDLRCEHVYFLDEGITIIDCIEFSPCLRTCDVASELAFLAMDLELNRAPALAAELVHTYAVQAEDEDCLRLLPFSQCYRAYVRGKVESLKSQEPKVPAAEQERARRQARRAFRLAYRYARGAPSPALVVVCGRVGTGKSTVAHRLSEDTGFAVLNSDVVRKRLAGLLPTARVGADYRAGIYSEDFTRRTYTALRTQAEEELHAGQGVIVDATCKQPEDRRALLELGNLLGVPVLFLECRASAAAVERRLWEREQRGDSASDATWAIALQEQHDFPPLDDFPG